MQFDAAENSPKDWDIEVLSSTHLRAPKNIKYQKMIFNNIYIKVTIKLIA